MTVSRTPAAAVDREATPPSRVEWIDGCRGVCVVAVVVFHICAWQLLPTPQISPSAAFSFWSKANLFLSSLRMPLLLAVSGMLAARRVLAGWRHPDAAVRVLSTLYLYVVWLIGYLVVYALLPSSRLPHRFGGLEFFRELVLPETPLWYLFALALYVVVLTSVRRVPAPVVLLLLTALSVAVRSVGLENAIWGKLLELFVFFAVGVYARDRLRRLATEVTAGRAALMLMLVVVSIAEAKWSLGAVLDAIVFVLRGLIVVFCGAAVITFCMRWAPVGTSLKVIGRRTLPIYVLHVIGVLVVTAFVTNRPGSPVAAWLAHPVVFMIWPVVLAAVLVAACLVVGWSIERVRFTRPLLEAPGWIRTGVRAAYSRRRGEHPATGGEVVPAS